MGCSCFASILNQFHSMLKDPAPLTSSRKPSRDLPIGYDLLLHGLPICLVRVSPQALNYFAVTPERHGRALQPSGPLSLGFLAGEWDYRCPALLGTQGSHKRHPHRLSGSSRQAAPVGNHGIDPRSTYDSGQLAVSHGA